MAVTFEKPIESCQKLVKPVRFVHFSVWYGLVGVLRIRLWVVTQRISYNVRKRCVTIEETVAKFTAH